MSRSVLVLCRFVVLGLAAGGLLFPVLTPVLCAADATVTDRVDFVRDIQPIFKQHCLECHGAKLEGGLRLDSRARALAGGDSGQPAIIAGDPGKSRLIRLVRGEGKVRMPFKKEPLPTQQIDQLVRWVAQGAIWPDGVDHPEGEAARHWAFVKPLRPPLPKVKDSRWPRNGIDYFVLARLEEEGLTHSPEADRYSLIRRLSLDLIGLPPAPEEVDAFVADQSSDAYAKVVDRLLASPAYGERWARMWLDLARYADSAGYGSDPLRMNIWPYRDWVINALNRNLPYDEFTLEQLAGDLLPHPTQEQLVATAFHRNTMTNTEGGTDDEEFRVAAVKDRINTTAQVWMGLTLGCAQCHSHKYDPITQKEYYQFYAIFNQTEDTDQPDERPTMPLPTLEEQEKTARLKSEMAAIERQIATPPASFYDELVQWEKVQRNPVEWLVLEPVELKSAGGATLTALPDHSILASGLLPENDTYTVKARTDLQNITAVRLELLPDDSLPAKGPGRNNGNAVLTSLKLVAQALKQTPKSARFVRVELPGAKRILSLAEVQVFSGGDNVALHGQAQQSSVDYDGPARLAIDGKTDGDFFSARSTTHTKTEDDPWWEVDLGMEKPVNEIVVWNRTDGNVGMRLNSFRVVALNAGRKTVWETKVTEAPKTSIKLALSGPQNVVLQNASADYSQGGFEVGKAIATKPDLKTGWAVGGQLGQAHSAVFETSGKVGAEGGSTLVFTLAQNYGGRHTIGRFRLSVTSRPKPVREVPATIRAILAVAPDQRTDAQRQELAAHFRQFAPSLAKLNRQLQQLNQQLAAMKPVDLPVMRELPADKRRVTHFLQKGNFLSPGERIEAGLPGAFNPLPAGASVDRVGVAKWLVNRDNPLTARVAVNRLWARLFGQGLVKTEEDFGTQGTPPTHPELLDWLALEFMDHGWDMKAALRTMVMSATYRQSSRVAPKLIEKDPLNRLLSRAPRLRLDAEAVRDQALALSGLLSRKIGGPSVYPPQPDGLWRAAFNGQRTYPTSTGADRYRRGIYTFWRRTVPYPSMATFDAPSRENCTLRRLPTNTPLQAFVTLNDPAFVEMAQALGRRLMREGGAGVAERVRYGLKLCLARPATGEQVKVLTTLYEGELAKYRANADAAKKLSTDPLGPLPSGLDAAEAAAWTVVANVLLNMDGVLTKG